MALKRKSLNLDLKKTADKKNVVVDEEVNVVQENGLNG